MKTRLLILCTLLILILPTHRAFGQSRPEPLQLYKHGDYQFMQPIQEGIVYRLPECNPDDINSPCYLTLEKKTVGNDKTGLFSQSATSSETLECGVVIRNYLGNEVLKMWEDVNVDWWTINFRTNWGSSGTWRVNSLYSWRDLSGPSPTPNGQTYYYGSNATFEQWGTALYLGVPWGSSPKWQIVLDITGKQQWHCHLYSYQL